MRISTGGRPTARLGSWHRSHGGLAAASGRRFAGKVRRRRSRVNRLHAGTEPRLEGADKVATEMARFV